MIVYQADKKQFLSDNNDRDIADVIFDKYQAITRRKVSQSEIRSWKESLGCMARVLSDDEIPSDVGVAVEFHIPQSTKRIDITLTGRGEDNTKNLVIVELKQWDKVTSRQMDGIVNTYMGNGFVDRPHPSYQAWSYSTLLEGFNTAVYKEGGIAVRPCAYLHNYERDGVIDAPEYESYVERAPLFLKGEQERSKLREFIKRHVKYGDSSSILFELDNGEIRPSKALSDSLSKMMKGNPEFVLIDDQKVVYEAIIASSQNATKTKSKVVVVEGGPGTGKTVLAINLLVALTAKGLVCKYVSKNAAPRRVYESKLTGVMTRTRYANMFSSSGAFIDTEAGSFDVLIVDEAHRLNEKSGLYGNLGDNQIKELIAAAKCTVFFIDEDQRVTLKDIGSKSLIHEVASDQGAVVENHALSSQFRCSGSDGYIAWLDNALDIRETANVMLSTSEFDFKVFDSPTELHDVIEQKNTNNKSRVVAGYCWPWKSKKDSNSFDIIIGDDYQKRWNLDKDGGLWIVDRGQRFSQ